MSPDPHTVEQRLIDAFRSADRLEPSEDLWTRVVHSIDEDRAHRRRVIGTAAACLCTVVVLVAGALAFRRRDDFGTWIEPLAFEILSAIGLVALIVALGPAIRRFGRNYAADLWPANPTMSDGVLRLLDLAYYLALSGYVLLSTRLDRVGVADVVWLRDDLPEQLSAASIRFGGLLLLLGVLHALTMAALPFVALVDNSTRRGRKLPRWLAIAGSVALAWLALQLVGLAMIGLIAGAG
jgi:hypothetical protein